MATVSKSDLLTKRFGVHDVEIEGVGTVKVRPLSRAEALTLQGKEMPVEVSDRKLIAMAMVEPRLTEDEVAQWQDSSPAGEIGQVAVKVLQLSGMEERATAKEEYRRFRD